MGYNTWNDFRCNGINSTNVMKVADAMANLKLNTFGYEVRTIAATVRNSAVASPDFVSFSVCHMQYINIGAWNVGHALYLCCRYQRCIQCFTLCVFAAGR
jgi:hypothetical protein